MESVELNENEARRLADRVFRDHKRAELKRDRLDGCTNIATVRRRLIEAGVPRRDVDATLDAERRRIERRRRAKRRRPYIVVLGLIAVGFVAFSSIRWVAPRYDTFVAEREDVRREWAQIDALLQRRYDLIPNLVETVGGFAAHEEAVLTEIADAHSGYVKARSIDARMKASYQAERAIRTCALLGARYPELKSDRTFVRLLDELTRAEDQITRQRMKYNDVVATLNADLQTFEGRMVSALTGFELAEYYSPPDETEALPNVDFAQSKATVHTAAASPQVDAEAATPSPKPAATPDHGVSAPDDVQVSEIVGRGRKRKATLTLGDGTTETVRVGDRLDALDGRVVAINRTSMLVESKRVTSRGNRVVQTVRLALRAGAER